MSLFFQRHLTPKEENIASPQPLKPTVAIISFDDNCAENSGYLLYKNLEKSSFFQVQYYDDPAPKPFLNFSQGNFFDWLDASHHIIQKINADVLIWGCRIDQKIRINIFHPDIYAQWELPFFSTLNCLYLPLSFFQENEFPDSAQLLLEAFITAAIPNRSTDQLANILDQISRKSSPKGFDQQDMTFVLNLLSLMYLLAKAPTFNTEDAKLIQQMMRKNFELLKAHKNTVCLGCAYLNMGQLLIKLAQINDNHKFDNNRKAIECLRYARKYFNRYIYPFDFAFISYHIATLYFEYWKQTNDIQALRDAVFNLREAEKIYTSLNYPFFWAQIQKDLGYYLSLMGSHGKNDEILMLAIENYKNRQKIYTREEYPLDWAKHEEYIGTNLYTIGKLHDNEEYLTESIKYFAAAADVYEEQKQTALLRQMRVCQIKSEECILKLQNK